MTTSEKSVYTKPTVNQIGSFQDVTLGGVNGDFLDADFPITTPRGDLTFS